VRSVLSGMFLLVVCGLFTFCQSDNPVQTEKKPKMKASSKTYTFKTEKLDLELALTAAAQKKGLMYHLPLKANEGMLFVYEEPDRMYYWNPNVSFNIALAYFDETGTISSIHRLLADDKTSIDSGVVVQYVLEMREGWFAEKGIKVGDKWPQLLSEKWFDVE